MNAHALCARALLALLLCGILVLPRLALCHNIQITAPVLAPLSGGNTTVSFSVSWNNSWRITAPPSNWDAAWVFVKYRKNGGPWLHASLNDAGHTVPSNAAMSVGLVDTSQTFNSATNPAVGVFIYRSSTAPRSTFTAQNVALSWNYAQDGVTSTDSVEVRVFGIEVVYVPSGAFYAGDNAGSTAAFQQGSADTDPWYISSEDQISIGAQAGSGTGSGGALAEFYYLSNGNLNESATGSSFTLPANFPKGTQAFYLMKGEVSQGHWVAFFNTLTQTQKDARAITAASGKNTSGLTFRNNVSWDGTTEAVLPDRGAGATYSTVAMNYLSWADLSAYLDWAGLRPMSELEFERSARGPYPALAGEYVWGSTTLVGATAISSAGTAQEVPDSTANCIFNNASAVQGPLRVGAVTRNKYTRIDSGSGYFGAADLSGNVWEQCVSVGHASGRGFSRTQHGNGALSAAGVADVSTWPDQSGAGAGLRGGDWSTSADHARLSDRRFAAAAQTSRAAGSGGRGVRTAPSSEVAQVPLQLSPVLWLDAADTATIALNGSTVSQWRDKSGGARHAVQAATANQPTYSANAQNGKALLAWDGSNDSMTISGGSPGSTLREVLSGDDTYSIAMVIKPVTNANAPVLIHQPSGASWQFLVELNTPGNGLYWGDTYSNFRTYSTGDFGVSGVTTLFTLVKRGSATGDAYSNGTLVSSFTGTLANTPTIGVDLVLGSYSNAGANYNGSFAEIVISNTSWSDTERQKMEGYLAEKWGLTTNLPLSHPYRPQINTSSNQIPSQLSPVLWLDAADTSSLTFIGSSTAQWGDKSGGARHAMQDISASRPTYNSSGLNGKPILAWDGSNDSMTISGGSNGSKLREVLSGDDTYSIGMVIKPSVISNQPVLFYHPFNGNSWQFLVELNATGNGLYWGDTTTNYRTYSSGGFGSTSTATLFTLVKRGAGLGDAYSGGTLVSSFSGNLASTPALVTDFVLGSYSASMHYYNGAFAEIVVSNTEWSNTNRQQLEGYFAHKWGLTASLPANHPYKSTPP